MKLTGVYAIRCTINGKVYIGSTATSFTVRWNNHRTELRGNKSSSRHLQAAWNRHGEAAFEFLVLEECDPGDCLDREQFWIDDKRSTDPSLGYNLRRIAYSNLGFKHSAESKAKMSQGSRGKTHTPEVRKRLSDALRGIPLSPAHRKAISDGTKGKPKSEEHSRKVSQAKTGKKRPPFSEAWLKALSAAGKGKPKSEEHRRKLAEVLRRGRATRRARRFSGQLPLPLEDPD